MKSLDFDASIDLCGNASKTAVEKVRQAVEALPGAYWISVEWCGPLPGFEADCATSRPIGGIAFSSRIRDIVLENIAD